MECRGGGFLGHRVRQRLPKDTRKGMGLILGGESPIRGVMGVAEGVWRTVWGKGASNKQKKREKKAISGRF